MNYNRNHLKLCLFGRQLLLRQMVVLNQLPQKRHIFGFGKKKSEKVKKDLMVNPIEVEMEAQNQLTEEDVMRMRDVSRLPPLVRAQLKGENIPPIMYLWQMSKKRIRQRYALYGRASGLKPGVMWPSKEDLEWQKGYEKTFCKPFPQLMEELNERKQLAAKTMKDREKDVLAKLKQLPKFKKEFWLNYHQMHDQIKDETNKKEKLIQEVREQYGYDLDQNDPRFKEALLKKEEEKKRALKASKKKDKLTPTLKLLQQALANEAKEREREDQTIGDKSTPQTNSDNISKEDKN